jgi:hypothetical protein
MTGLWLILALLVAAAAALVRGYHRRRIRRRTVARVRKAVGTWLRPMPAVRYLQDPPERLAG